jgi:hypothetical protein
MTLQPFSLISVSPPIVKVGVAVMTRRLEELVRRVPSAMPCA